jgi:hypothetical protein
VIKVKRFIKSRFLVKSTVNQYRYTAAMLPDVGGIVRDDDHRPIAALAE